MLSHLLDHGNHPRIRIQGFQLLLLWLNDQTIELPECIDLYSNAISLDLFLYDQIRSGGGDLNAREGTSKKNDDSLGLGQVLIKSDERGPLFPNPHPPTFNDAVKLIQLDLSGLVRLAHVAAGSIPPPENYDFPQIENIEHDNGIAIGMGIDAAFAAAKFHFDITKKQYLIKLFPQCAKSLGLISGDDATPILKSIVLGPENREFAHEIVRQALMLPAGSPQYKDIVRGAVHIVGVWILSGEEERPAFLRRSPSQTPLSSSTIGSFPNQLPSPDSDSSITPSNTPSKATFSSANIYLRRYIQLLGLVFEDHSAITFDGMTNIEVESQVAIYRDVLSLYRSMISEGPIELEDETWETLLLSLLDIQQKIMNQRDKYTPISSVSLSEGLADYLVETILNAFARSKVQRPELWRGLRNQMSSSVRWSQTIAQWAKIMLRLTKILSKHVHHVDLDAVELNRRLSELSTSERHSHRRQPSKSRTRHLSLRGSRHKHSGSNSSREDVMAAIGSDFSVFGKSGNDINIKSSRRTLSIHQDMNFVDQKSPGGQALLNVTVNGPASSTHSGSIASDEEDDENDDFFDASSELTLDDLADVKSNRTSSSSAFFVQPNFSSERLSVSLANFRCQDFLNLEALSWNSETALLVWKNMLCALGNINHIQISQNHADAMKCLVEIMDMLTLVRNNQIGFATLPLHYEFAPWAFAPGRALAYAGLCKMMSRRPDKDFDEAYYSHFYRALLKGLSDPDGSITLAIINNSTKLFSQCLPGSNILYKSFIETIRNLLLKDDVNIPELTRQNAITILCSLICIVNQAPSAKFPTIPYKKLAQLNDANFRESMPNNLDFMRFSEVRSILKETLVKSLATEDSIRNYETHDMLLYGICTLAFDELTSWPNEDVIRGCFQALLDQLYWSHLPVVTTAADCLIGFAQNSSLWRNEERVYLMILQDVFGYLIGALNEHLIIQKSSPRNGRGFIIAKLFYCLLEWLIVIPPNLFADTELCHLVFDVIDLVFEPDSPKRNRKRAHPPARKRRGKAPAVRFKKAERKIAVSSRPGGEQNFHVVGVENNVEDVNFVKDVAGCVLLHLTHHFDNFSPPHGPAMMNSTLVGPLGSDPKEDEASEQYHYFSYNDTTIITLVEIPGKDNSIRDHTGRYAWDSGLFYKASLDSEKGKDRGRIKVADKIILRSGIKIDHDYLELRSDLSASPKTNPKTMGSSPEKEQQPPILTQSADPERVNMLSNLIQYLDCQTPGLEKVQPIPLYSPRTATNVKSKIVHIEEQLDRHIKEETSYGNVTGAQSLNICVYHIINTRQLWYDDAISLRNNIFQENDYKVVKRRSRNPLYCRTTSHLSLGADFSLSKSFLPVLPPEAEMPTEPYQQCRLFLSHFGWLNHDTLKDSSICLLNKTPGLFRDIRLLDKKHAREAIKVALLYVGPGQDDEQSILYNTNGSQAYDEFVESLGWEIDLASHPGYLGGLERNSTNGLTSVYYCTSTLEIIFHDVTKMPTEPTDPKQLRKKRHIGNDHVHVIFNENHRDYRKTTIGGDFGNAQIVVTPLHNGLFSVDIYRDSKISPFGPLLHAAVVSENILGSLRASDISTIT
ncbi:15140_t:CDS:10, partial [Acaulospora colombiana]